MDNFEIGKVFTNGKLSREILEIDGGWITYKTEKEKIKKCWITTFQDWVSKGEKLNKNITIIELSNKEKSLVKYAIEYLLGADLAVENGWTEEDIKILDELCKKCS